MKLHLPEMLLVALLAACGMAYGDLTVTTTGGKTTVSTADWTSSEYTTVTLFPSEKNATFVTAQQDATILGANNARVEIQSGAAAGKLGDIIVGRTVTVGDDGNSVTNNGQIFIQTWNAGADVNVTNNLFLGSSDYNNGGALRFGMDSYDATLSGRVTLIEDSTIGGFNQNQNHAASFTQNITQAGNHGLTLSNYFETHFDGGMSIGGITVQSGGKVVSIGAAGTESNMTGSIINTSSGTLTLAGTFNFTGYGENADMSKYTCASSSYATADGTWITGKGLATQHVDDYYAIRKAGSGAVDVSNATITGATLQADGSYTITLSEALANPTYIVYSGNTATQDDMAGATDLLLKGGSATITSGGENAFITGDISVEAGSTLTLAANNALGWSADGAVNNITLVGESSSNRARLTTNGSQTLATNLNLNGHTVIDGTGDFETFGGRIVASGTDNTISATLKARNPMTVEVKAGGSLAITSALTTSSAYYSGVESQVLTKAGDGELVLSGGILVNQDMDLTVTGGTGTTRIELGVAGAGAKSIKVKDGRTLTLNNVAVKDLRFDNAEGFAGTVVLNGVSGYLNNDNDGTDKTHTFANAISIGSGGFTINDGYGAHIYKFTGAISGSGNISRTTDKGGKQTYNFSDATAWSGKFVNRSGSSVTSLTFESSSGAGVENHSSGTMEVKLKGTSYTGNITGSQGSNMNLSYTGASGDVTVSGSVYDDVDGSNSRGTINVTVDNAGHTTTFSNWVTVHNLRVMGGSTADFIAGSGSNHFKPESLTLEDAAIIGVYTDSTRGTEADANISALTLNGNATMNANLKLKNNATLDMSGVLTMGSRVTIGTNTVLTIDESLGDVNAAPVVLFDSVDQLTLGTTDITEMGWYDANGIIASINGSAITGADQYVIGYWNGNVSVAAALVPEPATATLSLLALAGLCARRRRR